MPFVNPVVVGFEETVAREVLEETGYNVAISTAGYSHNVCVNNGKTTLVFFRMFCYHDKPVEGFVLPNETQEIVFTDKKIELCFPTHTDALAKHFDEWMS